MRTLHILAYALLVSVCAIALQPGTIPTDEDGYHFKWCQNEDSKEYAANCKCMRMDDPACDGTGRDVIGKCATACKKHSCRCKTKCQTE